MPWLFVPMLLCSYFFHYLLGFQSMFAIDVHARLLLKISEWNQDPMITLCNVHNFIVVRGSAMEG